MAIGLDNLDALPAGKPCTVTDPPPHLERSAGADRFVVHGVQLLAERRHRRAGKSDLIAHPPSGTAVNFVFVSNPGRPNGGILERFVGAHVPILDVTFTGATVTNSHIAHPLTTVDAVHQYDRSPTSPPTRSTCSPGRLAAGFRLRHPEGHSGHPSARQYQDSTYYLIATDTLPLLRPLTIVPFLGSLLATTMDPPLRVLVETGYNRTINPGAPTTAKYLYFPTRSRRLQLAAIPNGWDNGSPTSPAIPTTGPSTTLPDRTGWEALRCTPGRSTPTDRRAPLPEPGTTAAVAALGTKQLPPLRFRRQEQKRRQQHRWTRPCSANARPSAIVSTGRSPTASAARSASAPSPASAVRATRSSPAR